MFTNSADRDRQYWEKQEEWEAREISRECDLSGGVQENLERIHRKYDKADLTPDGRSKR